MRIALRTSGGRGEYELAGSQGSVILSDLFERHIILELLPGERIKSYNVARHLNGKPRIRLLPGNGRQSHSYLIIAAALILPKPKRQLSITPGGKLQLVEESYSVTSVQFDIVDLTNNDQVIIRPTHLILSNSDDDAVRLDIIERMRIVLRVWAKAQSDNSSISLLLRQHREAFRTGNAKELVDITKEIRKRVQEEGDPLRSIINSFNMLEHSTYWMGVHRGDVEEYTNDEDTLEPVEAAKERIKEWRKQASRGSEGEHFRRNVRQAYNSTCLFTGYHLPKISLTNAAGVDSAHILPWAEYELNEVSNGLCLNKLCHWAFDAGILQLRFDDAHNQYLLSVPDPFKEAERKGLIDLSAFNTIEGPVPKDRLPANKSHWPNPKYLKAFNQALVGS